MKHKIINLIKHPLFSGSAVMILGTNFNNVLNYLYHVFMARLLGPVGYGEMASLFSLLILIGTIPSSLNLSLVKFVSGSKSRDQAAQFIGWSFSRFISVGIIIFVIMAVFSKPLANYLNIQNILPVIFLSSIFIVMVPSVVVKSSLQGLLKFNQLIFSSLSESSLKLAIGVLFVYFGWQVSGSISAVLIASIIGVAIGLAFIKPFPLWPKKSPVATKEFISYSLPILVYSLAITSFFTADLILVKHFFSPTEAGTYAALSTLGKIIIFGAGPISGVMFPIVSQRHAKGEDFRKIFLYGLLLTALACIGVELIYLLFPDLAISLLYRGQYLSAASLLFQFGLFISFYTLSAFLVGFFLSINHTKIILVPLVAAVLQIVGIYLFHTSLKSVINVSIIDTLLMFLILLGALRGKLGKIGA